MIWFCYLESGGKKKERAKLVWRPWELLQEIHPCLYHEHWHGLKAGLLL